MSRVPDSLTFTPDWIQCRIGPRMLNDGKGASMSRLTMRYVLEESIPAKESSGGDWASVKC